MKKLWSHGWFAALFTGVAFLLIPTVSASAETSTTIQGKAAAAVPANEASPTPSGELIEFDVGLNLKDLPGAEALAKEVTDPTSRNYRRYLTPERWESRFSPSVRADREVVASLRGAGFKVTKVAPDRMTIVAEGTAEQIAAYFGTQLANYEVGEETVRLASSPLSVPTEVAPLISGVRGVNEIHAKPANLTGAGWGEGPGYHPGGPGPWWSGHGHGHGWHGHWPPPAEEETEIPQPAGFRNATPCSAYYGQELASTLPAFGGGFPNPLPYAVCGYKPAQLQGAYNLAGPISQGLNGSGVTVAIVDAFASPTLYSDAVEYAQKNQGTTSHGFHGSAGSQQWQPGQFKEMHAEAVHPDRPGRMRSGRLVGRADARRRGRPRDGTGSEGALRRRQKLHRRPLQRGRGSGRRPPREHRLRLLEQRSRRRSGRIRTIEGSVQPRAADGSRHRGGRAVLGRR